MYIQCNLSSTSTENNEDFKVDTRLLGELCLQEFTFSVTKRRTTIKEYIHIICTCI